MTRRQRIALAMHGFKPKPAPRRVCMEDAAGRPLAWRCGPFYRLQVEVPPPHTFVLIERTRGIPCA